MKKLSIRPTEPMFEQSWLCKRLILFVKDYIQELRDDK